MKKTLTYEEYVKIKNLLTQIKFQLDTVDRSKDAVYKTVDEINEILNIKGEDTSNSSI